MQPEGLLGETPDSFEMEFKGGRKALFANPRNIPFRIGDFAIVDVERGHDIGRIVREGSEVGQKIRSKGDPGTHSPPGHRQGHRHDAVPPREGGGGAQNLPAVHREAGTADEAGRRRVAVRLATRSASTSRRTAGSTSGSSCATWRASSSHGSRCDRSASATRPAGSEVTGGAAATTAAGASSATSTP